MSDTNTPTGLDNQPSSDDKASDPTPAAPSTSPSPSAVSGERLDQALEATFAIPAISVDLFKTKQAPSHEPETLEEVAEDLLELMKQMSTLEGRMASLAASVERLQQTVESGVRAQLMEADRLKEALISDRKEFIGRSTFNAIRPAMESLQYLKEGYEERQADAGQIRHTQALLDILGGVAQMLGYQSFSPTLGDEFDPQSMECSGYAPGASGKVVQVERAGYRAGSVLVRPCAVILGGPQPGKV
jgi:molecular chaperone GrpE (heat shock protein)